jgi:hypothetical protein
MKEKKLVTYIPETITIPKNLIEDSITAIESGAENTRLLLIQHDSNLGRTTKSNSAWAAVLDNDIYKMDALASQLRTVLWAK